MRFILGPLIDKYGARISFAGFLCLALSPLPVPDFVDSEIGLCFPRFFIGLAGDSFVMCQSWTSRMFTREIVGTANAMAAGWGNLGAGVTQHLMGSGFFPIFKNAFNSAEKSWRFLYFIPTFVTFWVDVFMYFYTDDLPKGNYADLKRHGTVVEIPAAKSFQGATKINSWLLALQYACSFGVELTMQSAAPINFEEEFDLTENANISSHLRLYGWMASSLATFRAISIVFCRWHFLLATYTIDSTGTFYRIVPTSHI
jgi:MFS transporter, NNP family, nitrate/nitrite transporter